MKIKTYVKIRDIEFEIKNAKGTPIMKDGKKIGEITDMYYEDGELRFEGMLNEGESLPELSFFYKKEDENEKPI